MIFRLTPVTPEIKPLINNSPEPISNDIPETSKGNPQNGGSNVLGWFLLGLIVLGTIKYVDHLAAIDSKTRENTGN